MIPVASSHKHVAPPNHSHQDQSILQIGRIHSSEKLLLDQVQSQKSADAPPHPMLFGTPDHSHSPNRRHNYPSLHLGEDRPPSLQSSENTSPSLQSGENTSRSEVDVVQNSDDLGAITPKTDDGMYTIYDRGNTHSPVPRSLPGALVAQRVNDFENFVAETAHSEGLLKIPMPPTSLLCSIYAEELKPKIEETDKQRHAPIRASTALFSEHAGDSSDSGSEPAAEISARAPTSGDIDDILVNTPDMHATGDDGNLEDDAPPGVESLQELIPEALPPAIVHVESATLQTASPPSSSIHEIDSMEKVPPHWVHQRRSNVSARTESYSSPDSPPSSASGHSRLFGSWRKDQDLFTEEPSFSYDGEADHQSPIQSRHPPSPLANESFVGSPIPATTTGFHRARENKGNYEASNIKQHDEIDLPHSFELSHQENESDEEYVAPISDAVSHQRWSAPVHALDPVDAKRWLGRSGKGKRGIAEDALFRQASIDVTSLPSTRRHGQDRPRRSGEYPSSAFIGAGGDRTSRDTAPRFGALPSRIPVMPTSGRPLAAQRAKRSSSTSAARYEDWPEYAPSNMDDASRVGRRHQSDMSFGATDRKADMLPPELLGRPEHDDVYWNMDCGIPERFGGRGWRRRFGRSSYHRESIELRWMKHLLRRRRRGNMDEGSSINGHTIDGEGNARWPRSGDRDLRFESELDQETVFSLLNRICPECGFRITVRRGNFKMKMEVPCGGDLEPLLVSVVLVRTSHGRSTMVCLSRSREDISGGPSKDIHAAATLLRKRLESHVEFIEDSFASLYLESGSGTTDIESRLGKEE